jgi:hypothetical protein
MGGGRLSLPYRPSPTKIIIIYQLPMQHRALE